MFYCEENPYYKNSNDYYRENISHLKISYWSWMIQDYKVVLLNKQGSYSDGPDRHWSFKTEEDRTFFILRWS